MASDTGLYRSKLPGKYLRKQNLILLISGWVITDLLFKVPAPQKYNNFKIFSSYFLSNAGTYDLLNNFSKINVKSYKNHILIHFR